MLDDNRTILSLLVEASKEDPELAEVIDLQHDLIEAGTSLKIQVAFPEYTEEVLQRRLHQGVPLLRAEEMALDWEVFSKLYRRLCEITAQHRPDLSERVQELLTALDEDPDQAKTLAMEYLSKRELTVAEGLDSGITEETERSELNNFVLNHALRPVLLAFADTVVPVLAQGLGEDWEKVWQKGVCPVCGGKPDIAYLDEPSGARHLVCMRCDGDWLFPRIKCPFCNTTDPEMLSFYASEDEVHRVYVCQNCRRYLKAIDLRHAHRPVVFPVERVVTVDLDMAARQKGFR
jgi:FdhE protein